MIGRDRLECFLNQDKNGFFWTILPRVFTARPSEPGGIMGALLGVAGDHALHQAAVGGAAGLSLAVVDPLYPA